LVDTLFENEASNNYETEVARMIQYQALQQLMKLCTQPKVLPQVKGMCRIAIDDIAKELKGQRTHFSEQLLLEIAQFEEYPEEFQTISAPKIPDGSPIGSFQCLIESY